MRKYQLSQHFLRSPKLAGFLIGHSNIKKRDVVLDIGAGSGVITAALSRRCKQVIAVAIDDEPVGIDIETIRHADAELIARTMNEEERVGMDDRKFTRLWTQKEAVVKAQGVGIQSFEQLQHIMSTSRDLEISTFEKENYIYSIAYGKLHCFGA